MKGSVYKHGKYVWVQDVSADFVCIRDGELVATIFSTKGSPGHHFPLGTGRDNFPARILRRAAGGDVEGRGSSRRRRRSANWKQLRLPASWRVQPSASRVGVGPD
jgi:hypothetical protein